MENVEYTRAYEMAQQAIKQADEERKEKKRKILDNIVNVPLEETSSCGRVSKEWWPEFRCPFCGTPRQCWFKYCAMCGEEIPPAPRE